MQVDFTRDKLLELIPNAQGVSIWHKELLTLLPTYEITTKNRLAAFLSQTIYESDGFTYVEESLNYSPSALMRMWQHMFNEVSANAYAYKPQAIANKVYANRMGNGDESSGDGWKYHGRGLIQIIGKDNYQRFASHVGLDIDEVIQYLRTPHGLIHSACWLWQMYDLNSYSDNDDIVGLTNRLIGGMMNVDDRIVNYDAIKKLL